MKKTLNQMKVGQKGVVEAVQDCGFVSQRLLEMGIVRHAPIEVLRFAPMGDPIEIKIGSYCLSLRCQEAQYIEVKVTA